MRVRSKVKKKTSTKLTFTEKKKEEEKIRNALKLRR